MRTRYHALFLLLAFGVATDAEAAGRSAARSALLR
jgi:hypothetical protein